MTPGGFPDARTAYPRSQRRHCRSAGQDLTDVVIGRWALTRIERWMTDASRTDAATAIRSVRCVSWRAGEPGRVISPCCWPRLPARLHRTRGLVLLGGAVLRVFGRRSLAGGVHVP